MDYTAMRYTIHGPQMPNEYVQGYWIFRREWNKIVVGIKTLQLATEKKHVRIPKDCYFWNV